MAEKTPLAIEMTVGLWSGIDGSMDNKSNDARTTWRDEGGDPGDEAEPEMGPTARIADGIREQGWQQVPEHRADDQLVTACLTRGEWAFIVEVEREALLAYDQLAQTGRGRSRREMVESAEGCRAVIALVSRALERESDQSAGEPGR